MGSGVRGWKLCFRIWVWGFRVWGTGYRGTAHGMRRMVLVAPLTLRNFSSANAQHAPSD